MFCTSLSNVRRMRESLSPAMRTAMRTAMRSSSSADEGCVASVQVGGLQRRRNRMVESVCGFVAQPPNPDRLVETSGFSPHYKACTLTGSSTLPCPIHLPPVAPGDLFFLEVGRDPRNHLPPLLQVQLPSARARLSMLICCPFILIPLCLVFCQSRNALLLSEIGRAHV